MRLDGDRQRRHLTRRALGLACAVLLVAAAPAGAATTRYAKPGGATSGPCKADSPCDLTYAIAGKATNDTIVVTPGTYEVTTPLSSSGIEIRGEGQPRPRLVGAATLTGPVLTVSDGTVRNLRIESTSASVALDLDGRGDLLELYSDAAGAAVLRGASELSTAVVHSAHTNATALQVSAGLLSGSPRVRYATIVATGSGSTGLAAAGLLSAPVVESSIVTGVGRDVDGDVLYPVSLDHSAYRFAASRGAAADNGTNVDAAPLFASAAKRDFQQDAGSPTVDRGAGSASTGPDLAGRARPIGAAVDIGAYELPVPPSAATGAAADVTASSAVVAATVNPRATGTRYSFRYGTESPPATATGEQSAGSGGADVAVSQQLTDLVPATTYHYRVVAANDHGVVEGEVRTFRTAAAPASTGTRSTTGSTGTTGTTGRTSDPDDVPEPTGDAPTDHEPAPGEVQADGLPAPDPTPSAGRSANAAPVSGTIRVRVPGSEEFVPLTASAGIPVGSIVDATRGAVTITSAADTRGTTQTANFGGSRFRVLQRRARRPVTDIVLTGGSFGGCSAPRARRSDVSAAGRRSAARRRLWGNGHGRFRTRGRHGTATVRGTHWLTEDRCDGTLVRVRRGLVAVRDARRRRTVLVAAGERYLAKAAPAKKRKPRR